MGQVEKNEAVLGQVVCLLLKRCTQHLIGTCTFVLFAPSVQVPFSRSQAPPRPEDVTLLHGHRERSQVVMRNEVPHPPLKGETNHALLTGTRLAAKRLRENVAPY